MTPQEKLFLQTVGRFVGQRLMPLQAQIDTLKAEVRELTSQVRELETGGVRYCGIYQRAADYKRGDVVTHGGSMWCAITEINAMEHRASLIGGNFPSSTGAMQLREQAQHDRDLG